jgi:SOS-response transcriptional repressor LexA
MEPEIGNGDIILVNPDQTAVSGSNVVVRFRGQYMVKQLIIRDGEYLLKPSNGEEETPIDSDADLIGVVVSLQRNFE